MDIIRLATAADLDAIADVAAVADPPSDGADVDRDYYAHVIERGGMTVAEASGIVIGYGGTIPIGDARQVCDLFLHPDAHGRGLGRQLLDAVWDAPVAEVPRQTFSSTHPSALPLYVRAGMRPRWPLLYVEGDPAALAPTRFAIRDIDGQEAAGLEESWLGWDRSAQYEYWSGRPGGRTFAVTDGDLPIAVGSMKRSRTRFTLLHMAAMDPTYIGGAIATACSLATDNVLAAVPGMSAALPLLLEARWRVIDHDLYCASESDLFDADRLVPHPGLL